MKEYGNGLTALGVRRPILITVFNLLIMLAGIAAVMRVDVRELPDVDRPIVTVRAQYDGASPKTIDTEVTSVIEGAVARVSGVKNIESASEEDNGRVRVEFQPGYDMNVAANDVREAVSRIQRRLPEDVSQILIFKADDNAQAIIRISAFSEKLSKEELAKRIEKDVVPVLLSIEGVADVPIFGSQSRVLKVLLDPAQMASKRISATEVIDTLRTANFDVPAGSYKSTDQELIVRAYASVVEPERVERLHVKGDIRIGDIGEVFYSPMEADSYTMLDGRMVIGVGVVRQAGSNTISIANEVNKRIENLNSRSQDYTLAVTSDDSIFIRGALNEVISTLVFAIVIVLFVIGIFLGQWRAVIVPAVTMPVSLVGTLAAIWLFGLSINLLTMLALVLATGLIVDDAIVVLENIQRRRMEENLGKMAAAVLGTRQVFFAVIATTATLVAVFLPIAFLPGQTGQLFKEFGLVLAVAVMISSFVAITLCPMLTSRLPHLSEQTGILGGIQKVFNGIGSRLTNFYFYTLRGVLAMPILSFLVAATIAAAGVIGFMGISQELVPVEDRGVLQIAVTCPDGASLAYTDEQTQHVEAILQPYVDRGLITSIFAIVGRWDKNRAQIIATLKPWDERNFTQMELAAEINKKLSTLPGAQIRIMQGNSLGIGNRGGGLEAALLGNEYEEISDAADIFATALKDRVPQVEDITIQYNTTQPELSFNIDREKARDLGVPMDRISQVLRVMVDRYDVIDLNVEDEAVPVLVGSTQGAINDPGDLLNIFAINTDSELVPLSALISVQERGVAAELTRNSQRRSINLDIAIPPGTALGDTMEQIRAVADDVLPDGVSFMALGEAASLDETNYEIMVTFLLALLVIFLVLAAQFESIGSAIIVMFTVPFGLAAAVFTLILSGQTINLYSQIGFVMLVGLMTKNAILLVEFMDQMRDEGMSVREAIMEGVRVRLRPVMMTVLSTVLGALPLILSEGPGVEARRAIGWVIFGGLGLSAVLTLYLAPLGYALIAPMVKPRAHAGERLEEQLEGAANGLKQAAGTEA